MRRLGSLVLFAFLASSAGCVTSSRLDDAKEQIRQLSWKVEAAERATVKAEAEKRLAQKELELARGDARVYQEKLALESDTLKQVRRDIDEELKARIDELQAKAPGHHEVSIYGGVVLENGILFAPGQHELTKQGEQALAPMVEVLAGSKYEGFSVEIAGHSDPDPLKASAKRYEDNHDLGAKRANAVRRFLVAKGVPLARLTISSYGETRPLGTGKDKAAKAQDRRVEIVVHRQGQGEATAKAATPIEPAKPEQASAKQGLETDTVPASVKSDTDPKPAPEKTETPPAKDETPRGS